MNLVRARIICEILMTLDHVHIGKWDIFYIPLPEPAVASRRSSHLASFIALVHLEYVLTYGFEVGNPFSWIAAYEIDMNLIAVWGEANDVLGLRWREWWVLPCLVRGLPLRFSAWWRPFEGWRAKGRIVGFVRILLGKLRPCGGCVAMLIGLVWCVVSVLCVTWCGNVRLGQYCRCGSGTLLVWCDGLASEQSVLCCWVDNVGSRHAKYGNLVLI